MSDELESAFELLEKVTICHSTEAAKALNRIENYIADQPRWLTSDELPRDADGFWCLLEDGCQPVFVGPLSATRLLEMYGHRDMMFFLVPEWGAK